MKLTIVLSAGQARAAPARQIVLKSLLNSGRRNAELAPSGIFALTAPADTLLARQFLEAVADTLIPDSLPVARYLCADVLFRKHEPQIDTMVVLMRTLLVFLRASLCGFPRHNERRVWEMLTFRDVHNKP